MKLLNTLITLAIINTLAVSQQVQADPFTGFYKIAIIDDAVEIDSSGTQYRDETEGSSGRGKVFLNTAGKLRFSGWVENWESEDAIIVRERISLLGSVNPTTGRIRLTKIGGLPVYGDNGLAVTEEFVLNLKIIKRNNIVVGLKGSGSSREVEFDGVIDNEEYDVTGFKTRDLPE